MMILDERFTAIQGIRTRYLTAGSGPPVVLLHGVGESAADWRWAIPTLAGSYQVFAPDLFGSKEGHGPSPAYTPAFLTRFIAEFLGALRIQGAAVVGSSLGGLIALRLALAYPALVRLLALVDSSGLGREIHPALIGMIVPGMVEVATAWAATPLGAIQRAGLRVPLLFSNPLRIPKEWFIEQYRLARTPYFLSATLNASRADTVPWGQREVLLNELPRLDIPTLVVWGEQDVLIPVLHARNAMDRLRHGHLALLPSCGHLPHIEQKEEFAVRLREFLNDHTAPS